MNCTKYLIVFSSILFLCLSTLSGPAWAVEKHTASITVDLQNEKAPVPAGLYGIFMEEISHAFDGGLYGELIQNRSFEEGVLPPGMKLVKKEDGGFKMELESLPAGVRKDKWPMPWPWSMNCNWNPDRKLLGWSLHDHGNTGSKMKLTEANPMNTASALSLELTVANTEKSTAQVSLANSGYWGINVQEGNSYRLKFYLRPGTFQGRITAVLENKDGKDLATTSFGPISPSTKWKKYTATLKATRSDPKANFVLTFEGKGTLQLDWVSLFPPTFKNRPNGLRMDLAKYLEELKPNFVRYPGGCYVQGLSWESAPDWRKMVCSPEERPGMWGYWKYRSTDGFGYHEFLEFSEDIKADAMYVSFAGMTVHPENNMPLDKIGPVIEQTLDAIEYAIGPVDSKWGGVRANMGHPGPFPLKYIEIGNEHPPAIYGDYYKKFRSAIKAKYPEMVVIMSMYWSGLNQKAIDRAGDDNIDIIDEHAYKGADWIRSNFDYFDKYPRKPWKVYVGEYASHSSNGNLLAAMGDSVYLMMMERNGDMVTMASYAPLFSNVNQKNWGVNLIEFDSSRSFAHASYYVQKAFNENRPDVNLAVTTGVYPRPNPEKPLFAGKFGLGSWDTKTEFKELKIYDKNGKLVFSDDFKTLENWSKPIAGQWEVQDGVLKQNQLHASPAMLLLDAMDLKTGKVTVKARRTDGREGFLLFFNTVDINRFLFCNYGAAGNKFSAIQARGNPEGCSFRSGSTKNTIEDNRWYDLTLVLEKNKAKMYLDDKVVSDAGGDYLPSFFTSAGYGRQGKSQYVVLKATNYYPHAVTANVKLDGAKWISKTGRHIVIKSEKLTDQNTLDNPYKIVPVEKPLINCSKDFTVTLEPYSVNILRVPVIK
ncbi:MAG: hypothetical protein FVQ82_02320 [Planctomycetes bacterium]|nr:hypothetical protein [Planctomycetota bacterium]